MSELVYDCPRCGAKRITFDVAKQNLFPIPEGTWTRKLEAFCICRACSKSTVFVCEQAHHTVAVDDLAAMKGVVNPFVRITGHISLKDLGVESPPPHVPDNIASGFREGATALAVNCPNAAGTMFRLCVDLATASLLPPAEEPEPPAKVRRDLGLRLPWLFAKGLLPEGLHDLSSCIKDDGNDSAHRGTLQKHEAQDMQEFTFALLDRLYSEPARLRIAKERREARAAEAKKQG